ncbi:hypothetical protein P8452_48586 [Trifolium repens]|nr:hypothetical protein P8452_48586 [Trifolium repens]
MKTPKPSLTLLFTLYHLTHTPFNPLLFVTSPTFACLHHQHITYKHFLCFFLYITQCVAMERKRDSISSTRARKRGKTGKEKVDEVESQELGTCLADLPFPIITDILLRLPIKSVLIYVVKGDNVEVLNFHSWQA